MKYFKNIASMIPAFKAQTIELQHKMIDKAFNRIVEKTPVDTGRARDSWEKGTNKVTSDVPYMVSLEYGHSNQAPAGMIRITLKELENDIRDKKGNI